MAEMIAEASSNQVSTFLAQPNCMETLTKANYLESIVAALDSLDVPSVNGQSGEDGKAAERLLAEFRAGREIFDAKLAKFMEKTQEINTYDVVQPTVSWAQDLRKVYIEVKFAHRFDAPGCANHTDVQIAVDQEKLSLTVLCLSLSSKIKYVLDLPLWAPLNID